jgi:hypothetical protein
MSTKASHFLTKGLIRAILYGKGVESIVYYFLTLIFLLVLAILYGMFRGGVQDWLRVGKKLSKTHINKLKKGKQNYWWYDALHKELNLGVLYPLNKGFTLLYMCTLALAVALAWCKPVSWVFCGLMAVLCLLSTAMSVFARYWGNKELYGKGFVLFAKNPRSRGYDSVIFDFAGILFPIAMSYAYVLMTGDLWGMDLRLW